MDDQQHTDMKEEMRTEAIEVIVSSVEKFSGKYDLAVSPSCSVFSPANDYIQVV